MKENQPLFSVIVPVYNNENDLKKCVESILSQSYADFELILVDDGSTDSSPEICDGFALKDGRILVIHRERNGGVVAARNDGLFRASGKYIYYIDGDDWIDRELLDKASKEFDRDEPPDIFVFGYVKVYNDGRYLKRGIETEEGLYNKGRLEREVYPSMIFRVNGKIRNGIDSASLCNKIIHREILKEHYCKNTALFRGEDSVCSWECMLSADKIYFLDDFLYFYNRLSNNSGLKKYREDLYENNKALVEYLLHHLKTEKDVRIEQQINILKVQGILDAAYQEVDFHHSVFRAAQLLRAKYKEDKNIKPCEGMSLKVHLYILLLNLHCFKTLLLFIIFEYCYIDMCRIFHRLKQKLSVW